MEDQNSNTLKSLLPPLGPDPMIRKIYLQVSAPLLGDNRGDVDRASLYDCYTITVLLTIEDAGFCPKGEVQRWVEEHDLTYAGDWRLNTHGGQLSFGQSGMAGGMSHITEAYLQISGRAEGRQLPRCDIAYINGNGGIMSEQVSLILRGD